VVIDHDAMVDAYRGAMERREPPPLPVDGHELVLEAERTNGVLPLILAWCWECTCGWERRDPA